MNIRRRAHTAPTHIADVDQRIIDRLRTEVAHFSDTHRLNPASVAFAARHLPEPTGVDVFDRVIGKEAGVEMIEIDLTAPPQSRLRRRRLALVGAAAAAIVAIAGIIGLNASRDGGSAPAAGAAAGCDHAVVTSTLPTWAQSGFSADALVNPHVTGVHGTILGVLFTDPLTVPPQTDRANKILWVSRIPTSDSKPLTIKARLDGTGAVVTRTVSGGPGPSSLDLPEAGCWTLTLSWSGNQDTVKLPVVAR